MKPLGYIHTCTGIFENKIFPLKKKKKNLSTRAVLKKKKKKKNLRPHVDAKNEMLANQKPRSLGGKQ